MLKMLHRHSAVIVHLGNPPQIAVLHKILTTINSQAARVLTGHNHITHMRAGLIMQPHRTMLRAHVTALHGMSLRQIIQLANGLIGRSNHDRLLPGSGVVTPCSEDLLNHHIRFTGNNTAILAVPRERLIVSNQRRLTQRQGRSRLIRVLKTKQFIKVNGANLTVHQTQRATRTHS